MSRRSDEGQRKRTPIWIFVVFLLMFVGVFCVASYKVGSQLITEHRENQGFEELLAQVTANRAEASGEEPPATVGGRGTTASSLKDKILYWGNRVAIALSGDAVVGSYEGAAADLSGDAAAGSTDDAAAGSTDDSAGSTGDSAGSTGDSAADLPEGAALEWAGNSAEESAADAAEESAADAAKGPSGGLTLLPDYASLHAVNPDLFGWIEIEDTMVNYPVMYTPKDPEHYLHTAFDGSYSTSGVPFLDGGCYLYCGNYILYGHHMKNGSMFASIVNYAQKEYWQEHPLIRFDTLYDRGTYVVFAALYSRAYRASEKGVFRYYDYKDLINPNRFAEYVSQVRRAALYDTGLEVAYGDQLLTLSTCEYSAENGRFVVVARKLRESEMPVETEAPSED